jgi:hypothetical protein
VAFGFGLFSVALIGVGFLEGYDSYYANAGGLFKQSLWFLEAGLVWWVAGAIVWETGRAIRRMFSRGRFPRSFVVATTSIIGIGFVSYGIVFLVSYLQGITPPAQLPFLVGLIATGFGLEIGAGILQQYFKAVARRNAPDPTSTS